MVLRSLQRPMLRLNDVLKDTHLKEEETLYHYSRQQQSCEQIEVIGRQFWAHIKKTWSAQQWNVLSCEGWDLLSLNCSSQGWMAIWEDALGGISAWGWGGGCLCVCMFVVLREIKGPFQLWDFGSLFLVKIVSWLKGSSISFLKKDTWLW